MSSTSDKDTYIWSDEETRLYLQLRIEEKDKGNARNSAINDAGKKTILDKFQEVYGKTQSWGKFRNKYNTCYKQYLAFQRLTRNRTGLGYDSKGALEMSADWWKEREKEWPGVGKKFKGKMANMDLMIKLFQPVRVTGAEGWSEFTRTSPVLMNDRRYWPYFRNCIGALDGTHVPVRPPSQNEEAFRGRKGIATMNVLAICNFNMKFIYAYVGVPGRAHDTKVLTHCATKDSFFPHPPDSKYYLVDSGYPTRTGYLGPHRKTRYHLDLFARGGPPTSARELFNRKHSGLRSVIERTFGVWKAKWRILDREHPKYELRHWVKIVTATMALHNFIRDSHSEDIEFVQWERMEEYEHHGDEEDEHDGGHIPYVPTGDRVMEATRDSITEEITGGRQIPY